MIMSWLTARKIQNTEPNQANIHSYSVHEIKDKQTNHPITLTNCGMNDIDKKEKKYLRIKTAKQNTLHLYKTHSKVISQWRRLRKSIIQLPKS